MVKKINIFQRIKDYFYKSEEDDPSADDLYFIEGAADVDLIGYDSYVQSLNDAIDHGAKFIGLISDYGNGKSTLLNMLKNSEKGKEYELVSINLWNCDERDNKNNVVDIHRIFLHQLVGKSNIKSKDYYKKKINKNYSLFDIKGRISCQFYFLALGFLFILSFLEKIGLVTLFDIELLNIAYYFGLAFLCVLIVIIYKPVIAYKKSDSSPREIDENDTKDLYIDILDAYFDRLKGKTLIICLEELDRYNNKDKVLEYLKEFYKFYKETYSKFNVIFIISIKSAVQLSNMNSGEEVIVVDKISVDGSVVDNNDNDEEKKVKKLEEISRVKSTYEKLFDYILNLRPVNIHDYDVIVLELLKTKSNSLLENEIKFPSSKDLKEWKYLYKGENVKIRDIKHRYNFAISLFLSLKETSIEPSIEKCLFMAYLEDEFSRLYELLISKNNLLNDILVKFATKKEISTKTVPELTVLTIEEKEVLFEGLSSKYISVDYNYYFYKFPKHKSPFNIYEYVLYSAVFFDEDNDNIIKGLEKLDDNQILKIIDKRAIPNLLPDVVFKYPKLYYLMIDEKLEILENTIKVNYNIVTNLEKAKEFLINTKRLNRDSIKFLLSKYKETVFPDIIKLPVDERAKIRLELTKVLGDDVLLFSSVFLDDNEPIKVDEINSIQTFSKTVQLINYDKLDSSIIDTIKKKINNDNVSKASIIQLINNMSLSKYVNAEEYKDFIYSLHLRKYTFSEIQYLQLLKASIEKMDLKNPNEFYKFVNHLNYYGLNYDKHYLSIIENGNVIVNVKNYAFIINKFGVISLSGLKYFDDYLIKESICFAFNKNIRENFYSNEYYYYYVVSTLFANKVFEIEMNRIDVLSEYYIRCFENMSSWKYKITNTMLEFLYKKVDFYKISSDKLLLFADMPQTETLISAVLSTKDRIFINKYLSKISNISDTDKENIYKLIGDYKNSNKDVGRRGIINLKQLTKNKKYLNYLDGRKKKELVNC
ncbi:MAG: hypothetical protein E7162_01645 [Firmicutes bacterium]|nr:hypothetical protein [Bacillota bacterium]